MCLWCWAPASTHIDASSFPGNVRVNHFVIKNQSFSEGLGWGFPKRAQSSIGLSSFTPAIPVSSCSDPELLFSSSLGFCPSSFRLISEVSDTYSLCLSLLFFKQPSKLCNKIYYFSFRSPSVNLLFTLGKLKTEYAAHRKQLQSLLPWYSVNSPAQQWAISPSHTHFAHWY